MKIYNTVDECCGCTACANICAHHAIKMVEDNLGFLYPVINEDLCVNCGLCKKVCAFNKEYDISANFTQPKPFAVRHKNINEINSSQSGAAFIAFSDWILEQDGIVYGAGYGEHFRIIHKRATNKVERNEFKGSKYAQSNLNNIFKDIKNDLKNGKIVLFSGTPCQTAGLSSFIGKKFRENLYLIDLICHGVSSPAVWQEYTKYLEKKERLPLKATNFRDKSKYGWDSHVESFQYSNGKTLTYKYKYYSNITLRYSCGNCPFTNLKRPSDVTIGDFWGIEKTKIATFAEDNKGCSLILINTKKGENWFKQIQDTVHYRDTTIEECIQSNLQIPTKLHPKRSYYEKDFSRKGFIYVMKKYCDYGWKHKIKSRIKQLLQAVNKF